MAGDWIKVEVALPLKPEVWQIAGMTGLDADAVVGKLIRAWAWFDAHTENGNAVGVTFALLDSVCGRNGFAEAMALVGWLEQDGSVMSLPNFDRHNGKTAKNRALTAKRVASHKTKSNAEGNAASVSCALPREEKRREDTKKDQEPSGADAPNKKGSRLPSDWLPSDDLYQMAASRGIHGQALVDEIDKFRDYWLAQPGKKGVKLDWSATFRNWIRNAKPSTGARYGTSNAGSRQPSLSERVYANAQRIIAAERAANGLDDGYALASDGADLREPLDGTAWRVP